MIKLTLLIKKIDEGEFDTEYLEAKKEFIEGLLKAVGELREGLDTDKEVDTDKTVDGLIEKDKENEQKDIESQDDPSTGDDGDGGNTNPPAD